MLKPYNVTVTSYYKDKLNTRDTVVLLAENPIESTKTDGTWTVKTTYQETTITMNDLMRQDSEKVIQYLKERGITACPMNF